MEILQSAVTGNIIGITSLIVGVGGVLLTVRTMKSAKRIEEQIKKEKTLALDKEHFREYKEKCIKKLESKRKGVVQEKRVSYTLYIDTISIFNDLQEYKTVMTKDDLEIISQERKRLIKTLKELYCSENKRKINANDLLQFDESVAIVLGILKKGDYAI